MQQILGDHRFAQSVRSHDDDVAGLFEEVEGEQLLEQRPIKLLGPVVVEVGERLKFSEARIVRAALEAAELSLAVLDLEHAREPGLTDDFLGMSQQAVKVEP